MIIPWNKAPDIANWVAMDANGKWFWYRIKPYIPDPVHNPSAIWYRDQNESNEPLMSGFGVIPEETDSLIKAMWQHTLQERPHET